MNASRYVDRFKIGSLGAAMLLSIFASPADSQEVGPLVICGGGDLPDSIFAKFHSLAGGEEAHIVVIPTASVYADRAATEKVCRDRFLCRFQERACKSLVLLHTRDRRHADRDEFVAPLRKATAVWIAGGDQNRLAEAYLGTAVERELAALHQRGGAIGGTSAGAAIMSRRMIAGGNAAPLLGKGFDLLPGAIIDQHFLVRRRMTRLAAAVEYHGDCYGLGIDEGAAVVVHRGAIEVFGLSSATVYLPAGAIRRGSFQLAVGESMEVPRMNRSIERLVSSESP